MNDDKSEQYRKEFREIRKGAKHTQTKIAEMLDMPLRTIQDMEAGKAPGRKIYVLALQQALGI